MTAHRHHLLLRAFCDEFARCGMEHACTSPGLAHHADRARRSRARRARAAGRTSTSACAGFFALGAAKARAARSRSRARRAPPPPTSLPAVIEATRRGVPLIVLTADRPPELRDVGAGQTIDQLKLYGDAVKWFFEVGVHEATPERLRLIRSLACRAYWTARQGPPGPVHLNFPLREPLVLDEPLPRRRHPAAAGGRPAHRGSRDAAAPGAAAGGAPPRPAAVVIVAGRDGRDRRSAPQLAGFARARRRSRCWPIRCRARAAGRRRSPTTTCSCATRVRAAHRPQFVICASATSRRPSRCARGWPGCRRAQIAVRSRRALARSGRPSSALRVAALVRGLADARGAEPLAATAGGWPRGARPTRRGRRDRRARSSDELSASRWSRAALGRAAPARRDAVRRVVDADPRRRGVLPVRDDAAARARQPRRQRHRRHGLVRRSASPRAAPGRSCC